MTKVILVVTDDADNYVGTALIQHPYPEAHLVEEYNQLLKLNLDQQLKRNQYCDCSCHDCCVPQDCACGDCEERHDRDD